MKQSDKLRLKQGEHRKALADLAAKDDLTAEESAEVEKRTAEFKQLEGQIEAAIIAEAEEREQIKEPDAAQRESDKLMIAPGVFAEHATAVIENRSVTGEAAELNAALGIPAGRFPLELLAPGPSPEARATTTVNAEQTTATWLDRIFAETAAARAGVTMMSVPPGTKAHPVTTAGAGFAMAEKGAAIGDAAWTVGVVDATPKRGGVRAVFSTEDAERLPGLEPALRRDLQMALTEGVDRAIFIGADGGGADTADITGLTQVTGLTEKTLTQANKVKGPETLQALLSLVDGVYALDEGDLNIVASVPAATLWNGSIVDGSTEGLTIGRFLREAGITFSRRAELSDGTGNGKFGAVIGRRRGIAGAACACVWESGRLIYDPYSGAAKGEIALTLAYHWDFVIARKASFARLKFVT
ncbi:MAG: hypothetical protein OXH59_19290 [Rhodospirillaceae bacterium]|nr:hypothetical protein [Rhodospirillaceae bacterium]